MALQVYRNSNFNIRSQLLHKEIKAGAQRGEQKIEWSKKDDQQADNIIWEEMHREQELELQVKNIAIEHLVKEKEEKKEEKPEKPKKPKKSNVQKKYGKPARHFIFDLKKDKTS